jgi:hypothetical protein
VAAVLGLIGTYGDLKERDRRNLKLGDLKKGPNGGVSPAPQKKKKKKTYLLEVETEPVCNVLCPFRHIPMCLN